MPEEISSGDIKKDLETIQRVLMLLSEKVEAQNRRIEKIEMVAVATASDKKYDANVQAAEVPLPPPAPVVEKIASSKIEASTEFFQKTAEPKKENANLEENIGGKWFAKIGIVALVLGVSFLLKYAFDNNWIGETGRVMIGIFIGLGLLGLGERYIRKYFGYGQMITGGGLAILYLSIFAAFDFYKLIGQTPAFFLMILITAAGIILSLRYNATTLMMTAIVGGFATPLLVSTGQNNEVGLFSYVLLLDLAILFVSIFRKWHHINLVGFLGTALLFAGWADKFYTRHDLWLTMFFLTMFFLVYSIAAVIFNVVRKEKSSGSEQVLSLLSATAYFATGYALLNPDYHAYMGFFAVMLAVYYFVGAYLVKYFTAEDENLYSFLAFVTVAFISLAIPIQLEKNFITIGWLLESIALFYVGLKAADGKIKILGLAVFALAMFRLMFLDARHRDLDLVVFNKAFFTFSFAVLAAYVSAFLFQKIQSGNDVGDKDLRLSAKQLVVFFVVAANFFTIYIGSAEISFYFAKKVRTVQERELNFARDPSNNFNGSYGANRYDYYDNSSARKKIEKTKSAGSVALSLFWLAYGIILMAIGIFRRYKGVRVGGILLLLLAMLKLFFYDLWSLGTLYRIISSISLGVVLLSISFAYQKYKDKLKEII